MVCFNFSNCGAASESAVKRIVVVGVADNKLNKLFD